MQGFLDFILPGSTLMPHGFCFLWRPDLLWLFVVSHLSIALAYFSIPIALAYFIKKRKDIAFKGIFWLFSTFILCCGITHLFAIVTIWKPYYAWEGLVLAGTAAVSLLTAVVLWPLIPKALLIPNPSELLHANRQLQDEILFHMQTRDQLKQINIDLDKAVTLLKASNRAYQDSENRFKLVVNLSPAAIYTSVFTDDPRYLLLNTFISDAFLPITGYTPDEWYSDHLLWVNHVHPQDRDRLLAEINSLRETRNLNMQYRFLHKDGSYRWIHDKVKFLSSVDGGQDEIMGAWMDITEFKKHEEEMRLAAITFNSLQGIMITDADTHILRVNQAFTNITGYSQEEVLGKKPNILRSGIHDDAFYDDLWEKLDIDGRFEGEVIDRRKDGTIFTKWQSITALTDSDGVVTNYVSMFTDISEKKEFEEHIKQLAFYDPLTNLPNRRLLEQRIAQAIGNTRGEPSYMAILFLDLDHFKWLNDSLGHQIGDELLKLVAIRLRNAVQDEGISARLGGDEFVILLDTHTSQWLGATNFVLNRAERVMQSLNQPYTLNDSEHYFSASIGATLFSGESACGPQELLQQADTAMYRSKTKGRNTISFFDASMQEAADQHLQLERNLRAALEQRQFALHYQPQVDAGGNLVSAEALIHWDHPLNGVIPPVNFIPVAEDTGLILPIGHWAVREACQQIKKWSEQGFEFSHIAINVSARQFQQTDFVAGIAQAITDIGIIPSQLMLELTESGLMDHSEEAVGKMLALKALGVAISIDDFGTGYSSLAYLTAFPISQLKIDRSFVKDIFENRSNEVVVETIINMANNLGLAVVAEGVETERQLAFLVEKGCLLFQGYHFSRPVTAGELTEKWLKKANKGRLAPLAFTPDDKSRNGQP